MLNTIITHSHQSDHASRTGENEEEAQGRNQKGTKRGRHQRGRGDAKFNLLLILKSAFGGCPGCLSAAVFRSEDTSTKIMQGYIGKLVKLFLLEFENLKFYFTL